VKFNSDLRKKQLIFPEGNEGCFYPHSSANEKRYKNSKAHFPGNFNKCPLIRLELVNPLAVGALGIN
jgi:hypothetical protein